MTVCALLAMYGVQAFTEFNECINPTTNVSISDQMMATFRVCFFVHLAEFINSAFVGPYFQVILPTMNYQN